MVPATSVLGMAPATSVLGMTPATSVLGIAPATSVLGVVSKVPILDTFLFRPVTLAGDGVEVGAALFCLRTCPPRWVRGAGLWAESRDRFGGNPWRGEDPGAPAWWRRATPPAPTLLGSQSSNGDQPYSSCILQVRRRWPCWLWRSP
jgi:hypothetical protein